MENELIIHEWLEYNPEDQDNIILLILQNIYDVFLIHPVEKVIVKTNMTKGVFSPKIQEYIEQVQFPRLMADTKLRYVATIKSKDNIQAMGTFLWQSLFDQDAAIILHDFDSEEKARHWLQIVSP